MAIVAALEDLSRFQEKIALSVKMEPASRMRPRIVNAERGLKYTFSILAPCAWAEVNYKAADFAFVLEGFYNSPRMNVLFAKMEATQMLADCVNAEVGLKSFFKILALSA
jgi:hypothetical protein